MEHLMERMEHLHHHPPIEPHHENCDIGHATHTDEHHKHLFPDGEERTVYNQKLLDGWVRQPAPSCACAAIAGAVNALRSMKRDDEGAMTNMGGVNATISYLQKMNAAKKKRLTEAIGAKMNNVDLLIEEVSAELVATGKDGLESLGGDNYDVSEWRKATRDVVARKTEIRKANIKVVIPNFCTGCGCNFRSQRNGYFKFCTECGCRVVSVEASAERLFGDRKGERDVFDSIAKHDANNRNDWWGHGNLWNLDAQRSHGLNGILLCEGGIKKLLAPRPSTAYIGTPIIHGTIKHISDSHDDCTITSTDLIGMRVDCSQEPRAKLGKDDDEKQIAGQWEVVKEAFNATDTVIINHCTCHWSLIFALKEVEEEHGGKRKMVRQVLTARAGQQPKFWTSFEDMREVWLGKSNYMLIKVYKITS
jgi:hypothetical protein